MKRSARVPALLAGVVLLAGCEEQEAVELSRSVPIAILQGLALLAIVAGGFLLFSRMNRTVARREAEVGYGSGGAAVEPTARPAPGVAAVLGAILFGAVALGLAALAAWWVLATPFAYAEPSTNVFSWEDSVAIGWIFLVPAGLVALFELRLAAALLARRRWAPWGAGIQLGLVALSMVTSAVDNATG